MPIRIATAKRGAPDSGAPNTQAGTRSSASPMTPPSPVGSGHALLGGRHEAKAAAASAPKIHSTVRMRSRSSGRCVMRRQPQAATGNRNAMVAMPSNCIIRSALIAPVRPSMLRTGALVAWLSEGSCTDQVASATAAMPASPSSTAPVISCRRRRNAARISSER